MVTSATNINKRVFVPVPSQYLDVLVFIVVSDFEVRGGGLFCWYWLNCSPSWLKLSFHNHISHKVVEYKNDHWLNIFMFCKLQHGILKEFDTYRCIRLVKSLNTPGLIDIIWFLYKSLQNIKYVLNTMTIWYPLSFGNVGRQH